MLVQFCDGNPVLIFITSRKAKTWQKNIESWRDKNQNWVSLYFHNKNKTPNRVLKNKMAAPIGDLARSTLVRGALGKFM